MTDAGDAMLDRAIDDAVKANSQPSTETVCKSHEGVRQGIYALLLCEQDRRKNGNENDENGEVQLLGGKLLSVKGVHITGRDLVLICLMAIVMIVACKEMIPMVFQ